MTNASHLYLITNRASDLGDSIAPNGDLSYYSAALGAAPAGTFTVASQATVSGQMVDDLAALAAGGEVNLMIFIHGFDTDWAGIQLQGSAWMAGLIQPGGYSGVQIIFDWPSGDDVLDFLGAMDRARITAEESLGQLVTLLNSVRQAPALAGITINLQLLCHSMGNYLFQQGAAHFPAQSITQAVLVAAMLDYTTFNTSNPTRTQGAAISAAAARVNVYYSRHDDVLGKAFLDGWTHQLGKDGPWSYLEALASGFIGLDCSGVINTANQKLFHADQTHTAYFYIPETLMDMAAALMGQSSPFRSPIGGTTQGFKLADDPNGVNAAGAKSVG